MRRDGRARNAWTTTALARSPEPAFAVVGSASAFFPQPRLQPTVQGRGRHLLRSNQRQPQDRWHRLRHQAHEGHCGQVRWHTSPALALPRARLERMPLRTPYHGSPPVQRGQGGKLSGDSSPSPPQPTPQHHRHARSCLVRSWRKKGRKPKARLGSPAAHPLPPHSNPDTKTLDLVFEMMEMNIYERIKGMPCRMRSVFLFCFVGPAWPWLIRLGDG